MCCDDKKHCCPKGYICNPAEGKCDKNRTESVDWTLKIKGKKIADIKNILDCRDGDINCSKNINIIPKV